MTAVATSPSLAAMITDEASKRRRRLVLRWSLAAALLAAGGSAAVAMRPRQVTEAERYRSEVVVRGAVAHESNAQDLREDTATLERLVGVAVH